MGRTRIYASDADRQRAYRQRLSGRLLDTRKKEIRPRRPLSRPARLAAVRSTVLQLFDEYEDWLASLPESLQESEQASRLTETVDQLAAIIDLLEGLELPRGFGRD